MHAVIITNQLRSLLAPHLVVKRLAKRLAAIHALLAILLRALHATALLLIALLRLSNLSFEKSPEILFR